jgi:hypothetical protein
MRSAVFFNEVDSVAPAGLPGRVGGAPSWPLVPSIETILEDTMSNCYFVEKRTKRAVRELVA